MWNYVNEVCKAKEYFTKSLDKYLDYFTVHPSYGNFVMLRFPSYEKKIELLKYLSSMNVFVRDTTQAEMVKTCFRVTIGTRQQMQRVLNEISIFYGKE